MTSLAVGEVIDHPTHGVQRVIAVYPDFYLLENGVTVWLLDSPPKLPAASAAPQPGAAGPLHDLHGT